MKYENIKNLSWANQEKTSINCKVLFVGQSEYFPFSASPHDVEAHGVQIYSECVSGKWGLIEDYVEPVRPPIPAEINKAIAGQLLADTDWAMVSDVSDAELSDPYLTNKSEFVAYRNEVRAILRNPTPGVINWPENPSAKWSV